MESLDRREERKRVSITVFIAILLFMSGIWLLKGEVLHGEDGNTLIIAGSKNTFEDVKKFDVHPPTYYYLMKIPLSLGLDGIDLKYVNLIVACIASVIFSYELLKRPTVLKVAIAVLFALTNHMIFGINNLRSTVYVLLVIVLYWKYTHAVVNWKGKLIVELLLILMQNGTFPVIIVNNIAIYVRRRRELKKQLKWILPVVGLFAIMLVWFIVPQAEYLNTVGIYAAPTHKTFNPLVSNSVLYDSVVATLEVFSAPIRIFPVTLILEVIGIILFLIIAIDRLKDRGSFMMIVFLFCVAAISAYALGLTTAMVQARYAIIFLPFAMEELAETRKKKNAWVLICILLMFTALGNIQYITEGRTSAHGIKEINSYIPNIVFTECNRATNLMHYTNKTILCKEDGKPAQDHNIGEILYRAGHAENTVQLPWNVKSFVIWSDTGYNRLPMQVGDYKIIWANTRILNCMWYEHCIIQTIGEYQIIEEGK